MSQMHDGTARLRSDRGRSADRVPRDEQFLVRGSDVRRERGSGRADGATCPPDHAPVISVDDRELERGRATVPHQNDHAVTTSSGRTNAVVKEHVSLAPPGQVAHEPPGARRVGVFRPVNIFTTCRRHNGVGVPSGRWHVTLWECSPVSAHSPVADLNRFSSLPGDAECLVR
jgi:hypothetical protein